MVFFLFPRFAPSLQSARNVKCIELDTNGSQMNRREFESFIDVVSSFRGCNDVGSVTLPKSSSGFAHTFRHLASVSIQLPSTENRQRLF